MSELIASVAQELEELQGNLFRQHGHMVERLWTRYHQQRQQDYACEGGGGELHSFLGTELNGGRASQQNLPMELTRSFCKEEEAQCPIPLRREDTAGCTVAEEGVPQQAIAQRCTRFSDVVHAAALPSRRQASDCSEAASAYASAASDFGRQSNTINEGAKDQDITRGYTYTGLPPALNVRAVLRGSTMLKLAPRQEWDLMTELSQRALQDSEGEERKQLHDDIEKECVYMFQSVRDITRRPTNGVSVGRRGTAQSGNSSITTRNSLVMALGSGSNHSFEEPNGVLSVFHSPRWRPPFNPHSAWRLTWDMFGMFLVMYEMISIPVLLLVLPSKNSFSSEVDLTCNIYWSLDLALAFLTCAEIEGGLHSDYRVIAKHYARTWLVMDLAMVLPEWVVFFLRADRSGLAVLRVLKVSRALRLLRILKMENAIRKQLGRFNSVRVLNLLSLTQMILAFLMLNHFVACIWYRIGGKDASGWLSRQADSDSSVDRYTMALHWAISQFHGNSEIGPGNTLERIFAVSMQVVGLLVLSIFVSAVTNIILQERRCHKRFYERMENMRTYFLHHKVSSQLMLGVKTYLKNATDEEWVDDIEVLEGLPDSLQKRVLFEARMPTVESHCLFVWLKHQHGAAFRTICHSAIYSMRYMAATVVFEAGDVWDKLIFLEDGHLRYVADQFDPSGGIRRPSAVFRQISRRYVGIRIAKNSGLCELALWVQSWQSKGDLVAVSSSSLLCLDSSALAQDLCSFPDARRDVVMYVHGLVQEISDMEPGMLNDLWKQA